MFGSKNTNNQSFGSKNSNPQSFGSKNSIRKITNKLTQANSIIGPALTTAKLLAPLLL